LSSTRVKLKVVIPVLIAILVLVYFKIQVLEKAFFHILISLLSASLIWFLKKIFFRNPKNNNLEDLVLTDKKKKFIIQAVRNQSLEHSNEALSTSRNNNLEYIETRNWRIYIDKDNYNNLKGSLSKILKSETLRQKNSFLIFGESGAGKTFAIFNYIRERTKNDSDFAPLFISLSDWNGKKSLIEWTIDKASKIYHLDKKKIALGLKRGILFPIYDGLDRVKSTYTISLFTELMSLVSEIPMALVMKTETYRRIKSEYTSVDPHWKSPYTLFELKTLNPKQVENVLEDNKEYQKLQIYRSNPKFKYLMRYPLFLNLMIGIDIKFIEKSVLDNKLSPEHFFNQVWRWYELKMLDDSNMLSNKKKRKIRVWLHKIATNSESFFIEELQPSYLNSRWSVILYYVVSRLLGTLLVCGAAGLFLAGPFDFWDTAIIGGLVIASIDLIKIYFKNSYMSVDSILKYKKHKLTPPVANILKRIIPLIFLLGVYHGFTTPRSFKFGGEMLLNGYFSITEAGVGILIGILLSLFFGVRSNWQQNYFDIRPVERMIGSLKNYFVSGFKGGLLLSLIVVSLFYFINLFINDLSSINLWLDQKLYIPNKYLFAASIGFVLGYLFFGLFGFLQGDKVITVRKEKLMSRNRTPITKSFIHAFKATFIFSLITGVILGSYIGFTEMEVKAVFKALIAASGFGILAFAWFGGLDAICHWTLRFILSMEDDSQLLNSSFLHKISEVGFLRPVGSGYEFIHPSLKDYYTSNNLRRKTKNSMFLIPIILVIILSGPIMLKLFTRFQNESHWQNEYGYKTHLNSALVQHYQGHKNLFIVQNIKDNTTRIIRVKTSGKVKLGSFVGLASSTGTTSGFLGMSLGTTWNRPGLENRNHGALFLRKNGGNWIGFPENEIINYGQSKSYLDFTVKNGDILEVIINDKEWENNSGLFDLTFEDVHETNKTPQIVAHRGGAALAPENSIEAIENAIQLGVNIIEIDIRITKDEQLVLMHDKQVDRTTNGKGDIKNLTREDLTKLYLKNTQNQQKIPTLEEALSLISDCNIQLLIEVKTGNNYHKILEKLVPIIKARKMEQQVKIFSFNKSFCQDLKTRFPEFTVGLFVIGPFSFTDLPKVDVIGVEYHNLLLFKRWFRKLQTKYSSVYAWNVNSRKSMQYLIRNNVDAIIKSNLIIT